MTYQNFQYPDFVAQATQSYDFTSNAKNNKSFYDNLNSPAPAFSGLRNFPVSLT